MSENIKETGKLQNMNNARNKKLKTTEKPETCRKNAETKIARIEKKICRNRKNAETESIENAENKKLKLAGTEKYAANQKMQKKK
jgi:hypothetical protein